MSKTIAAFGACIALLALPAFADATQEINTAAAHAGMAAAADSPAKLHTHMQHTLNCLEGKAGADFDAGPGNPCASQGNGAIPDSKPAEQKTLMEAVTKAKEARDDKDFDKGKKMAADVQAMLSK